MTKKIRMDRRQRRRRRHRSSRIIVQSQQSPSNKRSPWLSALRGLEALAACTAIFAVGIWWFVERDAIKEQRLLNKEQIEILRAEKERENYQILIDDSAYFPDREQAWQDLTSNGILENVDLSIDVVKDLSMFWSECLSIGFQIKNVNFSGLNLSGNCFKSIELVNVNFENANLSYSDFENAFLHRVNFEGAQMFGSHFSNARRTNAYGDDMTARMFSVPTPDDDGRDTQRETAIPMAPPSDCWYWQGKPFSMAMTPEIIVETCDEYPESLREFWSETPPFLRPMPPCNFIMRGKVQNSENKNGSEGTGFLEGKLDTITINGKDRRMLFSVNPTSTKMAWKNYSDLCSTWPRNFE